MRNRRKIFWGFWIVMYLAAFVILCACGGYSDGDDAYFYQYTTSMGFLEYLGWRYETWVGRMGGEALVYIAFNMGLPFWRVVNAMMLVLLPLGVLYLAQRAARVPEGSLSDWKNRQAACVGRKYDEMGLSTAVTAVAGYLMMSAMTLGYAAVWVNGSIFYTWSFTCGIWALTTFADFVFADAEARDRTKNRMSGSVSGNDKVLGGELMAKIHFSLEGCQWWKFLFSIPCAVIASMSIEQMGAVLLVFEVLGVIYGVCKWRRIHPLLLVQTIATVVAFGALFLAPGNDVRVAAEIVNWMPQYDTMSLGQHLFITVHWLLSSFANENKLFLCGIWIAGILLLLQKEKRDIADKVCIGLTGVLTATALLPYVGITVFSDMGMQYVNIEQCIYEVPTIDKFTGTQIFAMVWWMAALVYTFVFLWRVSGCQITLLLAYLAGIASEVIMYFSPTMYASGARVYYLTDILYLFVIFALAYGLRDEKHRHILYGSCIALGVINFVSQISVFLNVL